MTFALISTIYITIVFHLLLNFYLVGVLCSGKNFFVLSSAWTKATLVDQKDLKDACKSPNRSLGINLLQCFRS